MAKKDIEDNDEIESGERIHYPPPNNLRNINTIYASIASRARVFGNALFFTSICLILSLILNVFLGYNAINNIKIVGIGRDGRPELLEASLNNVNPNFFAKEFLLNLRTYNADTVVRNITRASRYSTLSFTDALATYFDNARLEAIRRDDIKQILVLDHEVRRIANSNGFDIALTGTVYRTIGRDKQTSELKFSYVLSVVSGTITTENPWGWYVNFFREQQL